MQRQHVMPAGAQYRYNGIAVGITLALTLSACGGEAETVEDRTLEEVAAVGQTVVEHASTEQSGLSSVVTESTDDNALAAVYGASQIPYPVYPNGRQYRVGGENGLKIVVFQTEDSFQEVDAYYQNLSEKAGMPRLMAMNDYVRYSSDVADEDPWAPYRPGIVIHEFESDSDRQAVGATGSARTNIIMSF